MPVELENDRCVVVRMGNIDVGVRFLSGGCLQTYAVVEIMMKVDMEHKSKGLCSGRACVRMVINCGCSNDDNGVEG